VTGGGLKDKVSGGHWLSASLGCPPLQERAGAKKIAPEWRDFLSDLRFPA
jgi:hypothetical protein